MINRFEANDIAHPWRLRVATGTIYVLLIPGALAADVAAPRASQNNPCAIFGSGYVVEKGGGCARIGGRVRVERNVNIRQRTEFVQPQGEAPMKDGFVGFGQANGDGPSRAHLRLPGNTMGNVVAPGIR